MRFHLIPPIASLILLTLCSCGARRNDVPPATLAALQSAETCELYSIDPNDTRVSDAAPQFQGYEILGHTTITDPATRTKLIDALRAAARKNSGMAAACFNPRHAIRVTRAGVSTDFVICFECMQVAIYTGPARTASFLVTGSSQPTFDAVLKSANVPLAPSAK
jgi:hypothetical protein